jgi:hypothetical protein
MSDLQINVGAIEQKKDPSANAKRPYRAVAQEIDPARARCFARPQDGGRVCRRRRRRCSEWFELLTGLGGQRLVGFEEIFLRERELGLWREFRLFGFHRKRGREDCCGRFQGGRCGRRRFLYRSRARFTILGRLLQRL